MNGMGHVFSNRKSLLTVINSLSADTRAHEAGAASTALAIKPLSRYHLPSVRVGETPPVTSRFNINKQGLLLR